MKFTVYYGKDFFKTGQQTGKQLAAETKLREHLQENPDSRVCISSEKKDGGMLYTVSQGAGDEVR